MTQEEGTVGSAQTVKPRDFDVMFKILIVGETAVGKSCFLLRFTDGNFTEQFMATIGVDFKYKRMTVDEKVCKLQVWDTAGQERFRNITTSFYRGAHGVVLMFDITEPNSYKKIQGWINDIKKYSGSTVPILLVGNKSDMEDKRCIDYSLAKSLADSLGIQYMESSAKNNIGVEDCFTELTRLMIKAGTGRRPSYSELKLKTSKEENKESSWCCNIL